MKQPAPKCACGAPLEKHPRHDTYEDACEPCRRKRRNAMKRLRAANNKATPARVRATTRAQRP